MSAELIVTPARATNGNGNALPLAQWFFYETGSLTPAPAYADADLSVSLGAVVTSDADGAFPAMYLPTTAYFRGILKDADGAEIADIDPINAGLATDLAAPGGSALVGFIQSGTGAVPRPAQDKMGEAVSIKDFGTGVAAFSFAAAESGCFTVPTGNYTLTSTPTLPGNLIDIDSGAVLSGVGATAIGYAGSSTMRQSLHNSTVADQFATRYYRRNVSHAGGTVGWVASTLRVDTYVNNASATDFQWGITSLLDNNSAAGENVAGYFIGRKKNTGPTWGSLSEVIETTPVDNPTTGTVATELDVSVNGTDNVFPYARVGADLVVRKFDQGGADAQVGWGFRIQNGGNANSLVRIGFGFSTGMRVVDAFDCSKGVVLASSLKMAAGVPISFDADGQHLFRYASTVGLAYSAAGTDVLYFGSDGSILQSAVAVASLASPAVGRRAVVNDSSAAAGGNFGAVVAGGGANVVPVFADGTNWRIG